MEPKQEYTIEEVITATIRELESVRFPSVDAKASLQISQEAALPILRAIENLNVLLKVYNEGKTQAEDNAIDLGEIQSDEPEKGEDK
jgi:hypothetical protein